MIVRNEKSLEALKLGERDIGSVYLGDRLIWQNNAEYITLPYIVSNGNSWADTGLYLDPTIHRVQGSFIVDSLDMVSTGNIYPMEGARTNNYNGVKVNTMIKKLSSTTYEIRRDWGRSSGGDYDGVVYEVGKEYLFDFTPEYTQIGDLRIDRVPETTGLCGNTYYIGYVNDLLDLWSLGYIPPAVRGTKRIFSVYATGEIIGEYIPTLNKLNNTFNYFDKVSEKYLENKGTEPWTAAYEAWVYQMGRPLSYLESDGNQWIDTGYLMKPNSILEYKVASLENISTHYLYGADNGGYTQNQFAAVQESGKITFSNRVLSNNFYQMVYTLSETLEVIQSHKNVRINGEEFNYNPGGEIVAIPSHSLYLHALNRAGTVSFTSKSRFSYFRAKEDGVIAINLIPFITWEGIKGYLNLMNRELLLNQGTGEFEVPTIPVYAINWRDEAFDPIAGKVATIGSSNYTSGLLWDDWTEAQKQTFRGKKMRVSWRMSANEVVIGTGFYYGFVGKIYYKDGTSQTVSVHELADTIFSGLNSPYTLIEDYSLSAIIQIEDNEIDSIIISQNRFYLPQVQSGELKAYDIKWEVDVPEYEIDAIETLNASGIQAYANHEDNINALNRIGIKI